MLPEVLRAVQKPTHILGCQVWLVGAQTSILELEGRVNSRTTDGKVECNNTGTAGIGISGISSNEDPL